MLNRSYLNTISQSRARVEELQTKIATNKRIQNPSDDPAGTSRLMRLSKQAEQLSSYRGNIENGLAFAENSTIAMETINDEVSNVLVTMTRVNNSANQDNMSQFAESIDASLNAIMQAANSEYDGKFLFGGTDFNQPPYGYTADESAIELKAGDVSGEHLLKISKFTNQKINITGKELFGDIDGSTDIFNTLISIRDDLRNGVMPDAAATERIEDFSKNVVDKLAREGTVINKLTDTDLILENQEVIAQDLLSKENDTDIAKSLIDLQNQEYILELSYKMSSMILPKSLMDYI